MTATATRIAATRNPIHAPTELRAIASLLAIVAMSTVLGVVLALSVMGAAGRSGIELPAPGPIPMAPPSTESESQPIPQPEVAPPGLDL